MSSYRTPTPRIPLALSLQATSAPHHHPEKLSARKQSHQHSAVKIWPPRCVTLGK